MTQHLQKHIETLAEKSVDQNKVREAATALHKEFGQLKSARHRDELRQLRASTEAQLQRKDLNADARNALDTLEKTLTDHAIESPLLDPQMSQKLAQQLPDSAQSFKEPLRKVIDAGNEGTQRGFEMSKKGMAVAYKAGKKMWESNGVLGKIAVFGIVAGGVYLAFKLLHWAVRKIGQGFAWLWKNKWKILGLGGAGYVGYRMGENHGRQEQMKEQMQKQNAPRQPVPHRRGHAHNFEGIDGAHLA